MTAVCATAVACSRASDRPVTVDTAAANAGIDSLNARIIAAYRSHDADAYGTLYTDSAVFEWPAFNTVHGRAGMAAMARDNWAQLRNMDLVLTVANRRIASDHATEFGAFQQSWSDTSAARNTEYGRYVALLVRQGDGHWLMDRFFGFEDSTRAAPAVRRSAAR